jgi:hypothetical protein
MATQELTLKAALVQDRATTTLARYKSRQMVKLQYRSAGRKPTSIRYRELCEDADRYLNDHREERMARAQLAYIKLFDQRKKPRKSHRNFPGDGGAFPS